jgi:hypothetical protein
MRKQEWEAPERKIVEQHQTWGSRKTRAQSERGKARRGGVEPPLTELAGEGGSVGATLAVDSPPPNTKTPHWNPEPRQGLTQKIL